MATMGKPATLPEMVAARDESASGPWEWEEGEDRNWQLQQTEAAWVKDTPEGPIAPECSPVLVTVPRCKACDERGAHCMDPSPADRTLIALSPAAVTAAERLAKALRACWHYTVSYGERFPTSGAVDTAATAYALLDELWPKWREEA